MSKSIIQHQVWKNVEEYVQFARKHKVYGADAVKLKQQMESIIPLPRVSSNRKKVR